ncbi:uncharacterized protein L3040_001397 [Drepanopeziza brunnea f. sp. 'multigermtubi']|uniref:uncharacterized protein n=1 Tax=Drepanopeziza brunnea f. sp. 'multigermtubi' TaxID=698441 RepID=UPI00239A7B8B|nr:hypothetical protein L3040_001397 [Drepanopeziza brunnea f. sp. 'multigermtubi']
MGCLDSLFSALDNRRETACKDTESKAEGLAITSLPTEVLEHVTRYLPPSSAQCFSMSCKKIRYIIGNQHMKELAKSHDEWCELLELIAREMPYHVACRRCSRFHDIRDVSQYIENTYRHENKSPPCHLMHWGRATFSECIFAMMLKRRERGLQTSHHLKMLSGECDKVSSRADGFFAFPTLHEIAAIPTEIRLIDGSFLMRRRIIMPMRRRRWPYAISRRAFCPHMRGTLDCSLGYLGRPDRPNAARRQVFRDLDELETDRKGSPCRHLWPERLHCEYCPTEYQIDVRHYGGFEYVAFCTVWKDLGSGPESDLWHTQLLKFTPSPPTPRHELEERKVAERFQQGGKFVFDARGSEKNAD